jgi:hypothetical protein
VNFWQHLYGFNDTGVITPVRKTGHPTIEDQLDVFFRPCEVITRHIVQEKVP